MEQSKQEGSHNIIMLACLAIPVALLIAVYVIGIKSQWIYWFALLMCPLMHFAMMYLHKEKKCH